MATWELFYMRGAAASHEQGGGQRWRIGKQHAIALPLRAAPLGRAAETHGRSRFGPGHQRWRRLSNHVARGCRLFRATLAPLGRPAVGTLAERTGRLRLFRDAVA